MTRPLPMHGTITTEDWRRGLLAARLRRIEQRAKVSALIAAAVAQHKARTQ